MNHCGNKKINVLDKKETIPSPNRNHLCISLVRADLSRSLFWRGRERMEVSYLNQKAIGTKELKIWRNGNKASKKMKEYNFHFTVTTIA